MDWLEELLRLPATRRAVWHQPETPRYARARQKLSYVLHESTLVGVQRDPEREDAVLLALWAPPGHGAGYGYYSCFRLFLEGQKPIFAVMYCFYDGTEGAPGFKSIQAARAHAEAHGFAQEL